MLTAFVCLIAIALCVQTYLQLKSYDQSARYTANERVWASNLESASNEIQRLKKLLADYGIKP